MATILALQVLQLVIRRAHLDFEMRHTICFNLTTVAFYDFAQLGPFRKVFKVEADIVGFCQVIEVAWVEFQEISWRHRPN